MAENIQWIDGNANIGKEKICPARHIRQGQWQDEWNQEYPTHYSFISDFECIFNHPLHNDNIDQTLWDNLQKAKETGIHLKITNLAHFTKPETANAIIESGGFIGGMKKFNEDNEGRALEAKFSWWSPIFSQDDVNLVMNTLGKAIRPFVGEGEGEGEADEGEGEADEGEGEADAGEGEADEGEGEADEGEGEADEGEGEEEEEKELELLTNQFATSAAFNLQSSARLYGCNYFLFAVNDLCEHYQKHIGNEAVIQYRILGTFRYKQEVMHAVLVCSQVDGNEMFKDYPLVTADDGNNEAVVTRNDNGSWSWRPQSTATEIMRLRHARKPYPKYRRWEHVAFAFHLTDTMNVPNPENYLYMV